MAEGPEQRVTAARPFRRVVYGEAARRLMLRPEATSLAAVVILFVVFTLLSPQLFPTKLTYISLMSVASELGIVSIGVTLLMIGGHFDLSVGAVLGLTSQHAPANSRVPARHPTASGARRPARPAPLRSR